MTKHNPAEDPFAALMARVTVIERSNRTLRALVSVLLLGAGAFATAGATVLFPDTLVSRSFRLVDAGGAERAAIAAGDAGTAVLTLYEGEGRSSVTMTVSGVAPFLVVKDSAGRDLLTTEPVSPPAPEKRGRIGWGNPAPAGETEKEDDSFDWAD